MISLKSDERGLTLIEVLLTLSIMSIVGIIIWSVFFQGFEFSKKSTSKNFMIQETNLLITNIKKIHQKANDYSISIPNTCEILIEVNRGTEKHEFSHPKICFEYLITNDPSDLIDPTNIDPNQKNIHIKFITSERQDRNNKITIDTILYRLKEGGI
jgi:prepilin-type N-terminal cleavage/methylation domain-containing protein